MSNNSMEWEQSDFSTKDKIFSLFKSKDYSIGDGQPIDPALVFGTKRNQILDNITELYQVVLHQDAEKENLQVWLLLTTKDYHKKTWRNLITKTLVEWTDAYVVFFTHNFSDFWISIITDDVIEEILFQPSNPSPKADRFIRDLLNKRPLIDPKGLTASQLQAKHQLTASKLAEALRSENETKVRLLFQRAGLCPSLDSKLIICREGAPLKNTAIIVEFTDTPQKWILANLANILGDFHTITETDLSWIILIGNEGISYFSGQGQSYSYLKYPKNRENLVRLLTTVVACIDIRSAFNGTTFETQFGPYSPFFAKVSFLMKQYLSDYEDELKIIRDEWEQYFGKVYQAGDINEELFIKHSYLSLLVKNVLFSKYLPRKVVKNAKSFLELSDFFEKRGVELFFNDFYTWANEINELREDIFQALQNAKYESDDIFRVIYQDMVSPATRHALGEFYTPPELARLMVDEVYKFGKITLDPACGSGTFLVEIIKKIKQSGQSKEDILIAISNLYGFDVNPIAVLVAKANILLHIEEFSAQMLPINVFLTDSLRSLEKNYQSSLIWGGHEIFPLGKFDNLIINERFFIQSTNTDSYNYLKDFCKFLQFIDEKMVEIQNKNLLIKTFDEEFKHQWLSEQIPNSQKTYRDNIHFIIDKIIDLDIKKQNHIWLYLLYNSIGARFIRNNVDLVIGNPPWLTMSGILSNDYKNEIKRLTRKYDILYGQEAKNIEICSLFFHYAKTNFLTKSGKIFFVTTAALLTGNQHAKFRLLKGFKSPIIWKFNKDLFKIHNICFLLEIGNIPLEERLRYKILTFNYDLNSKTLSKMKEEFYNPAYIKNETKKIQGKEKIIGKLIGRMIPEDEIISFPVKPSLYRDLFSMGIRFLPRRFLVCIIVGEEDENYLINPDLSQQAKEPYLKAPYKEALINIDYIHNFVSTHWTIPFYNIKYKKVFFPIKKSEKTLIYNSLPKNVKSHYELLNTAFQKVLKDSSSVENLWENMIYGPSTINPRDSKKYFVLSGANAQKSLIIPAKDAFVDKKFYFFETEDLNEAYYLCGYLNAPIVMKNVKKIGGTGSHGSLRNIEKRPFDFPLPLFKNTPLQMKLVEVSKKCEIFVKDFVNNWIYKNFRKNQNKLYCPFCFKPFLMKSVKNHIEKCIIKKNKQMMTKQPISILSVEDIILRPRTIQNELKQSSDFNLLRAELSKYVKQIFEEEFIDEKNNR